MKRLRLQNSMLVAMVGANLFSGLSSDDAYRAYRRSHCTAGQIIVVGTDGVWETRNAANEMFGKQRVRELVRRHARSNACRIRDEILEALRLFLGPQRAEDDITLMVVKITGDNPVCSSRGSVDDANFQVMESR